MTLNPNRAYLVHIAFIGIIVVRAYMTLNPKP